MTTEEAMTIEEHVSTALQFLEHSDREFAAGDALLGSEKLWGAVSQALMAVAKQRGWAFGKTNARRIAVRRLSEELNELALVSHHAAAELFHANFYNDFMVDSAIEEYRPLVARFVERMVELASLDA